MKSEDGDKTSFFKGLELVLPPIMWHDQSQVFEEVNNKPAFPRIDIFVMAF